MQVKPVGPAFGNVSGDGGRIVVAKIIVGGEVTRIGAFLHAPYCDPLLIEILNDCDFRDTAGTVDGVDDDGCDQKGDANDGSDPGQHLSDDADRIDDAHRCGVLSIMWSCHRAGSPCRVR